MGKIGDSYGSEFHLKKYLTEKRDVLNEALSNSIGTPSADIRWIETPSQTQREWKGMAFLRRSREVQDKWRSFWPQTGNPPNWDAVATIRTDQTEEWVLVEAKANHPEFCSKPSGAVGSGRTKILAALEKTKKHLGVHRDYAWEGTYYQYANRLACLYFLNIVVRVPARLVFIYFVGDCFPDGRWCPTDEDDWKPLIHACHLTLGLPEKHALSDRIHRVFIPVYS